jgi:hypothetical protein
MAQLMAAVPWPSTATELQTLMGTHTVGPGVGSQEPVGCGEGTCVGLGVGTWVGSGVGRGVGCGDGARVGSGVGV